MLELLRKLKQIEIRVRRRVTSAFIGEYRSAFKGSGLEFDEVRAYQYGDDVRSIDWNVSAKSTEMFVKVFREERELTVFVLLDISGSEQFGPAGHQKLDIATELTAMLGYSALLNNDKFGLAAFTDKVELYFRPTKGRNRLRVILSVLLNRKPGSRKTNLRMALEFYRRIQKRRSLLFVISDFLDDGYERTLALLHRKHEVNLIRLYHPTEQLTANLGILPVVDAESGNTRWVLSSSKKYREKLQQRFSSIDAGLKRMAAKYDFGYLALNVEKDYLPPLEHFFLTRKGGKRGIK